MNTALPLDGIRVVEFVHMVMGPTCGLVLADLGAEVIKIEPAPHGDNTRRLTGSGAGYWATYNRNKKSLCVDLHTPEGLAIAKRLLATADVMTENFRPGAMEKLGLGYDDVKPLRSDIIYCSMKGFLPGPYGHRAALDEVVQMMGGLAYMTGLDGRPLRVGTSVNDIMGGVFGAMAVMAALIERGHTRRGQHVQSALYENTVFLVAQHMMQFAVTGRAAPPMSVRSPAWGIYDVFTSSEGEQVFVGVVTDTQWKIFCEAFGLAEFATDTGLATNPQRVKAREWLLPALRETFSRLTKAELIAKCEQAGLPFGPVTKPEELFDDRHLNGSCGFTDVTLPDGRLARVPMLPFEMDGRRFGTRLDLPAAGRHTQPLLEQLGYGDADIRQLAAAGIIRTAEEQAGMS